MDWLTQCFGTNCKFGVEFVNEYTKGNITSNLTADKIDNDEDHNLSNVHALSVLCNTSISKIDFYFWVLIKINNRNDIISKVYYDPSGYGSIRKMERCSRKGSKHKTK